MPSQQTVPPAVPAPWSVRSRGAEHADRYADFNGTAASAVATRKLKLCSR